MDTYPSTPGPRASNAEKYVFQLLSDADLGSRYCAFHSLLLPSHARKFIGQADFVVKISIPRSRVFVIYRLQGNGSICSHSGPFRGQRGRIAKHAHVRRGDSTGSTSVRVLPKGNGGRDCAVQRAELKKLHAGGAK